MLRGSFKYRVSKQRQAIEEDVWWLGDKKVFERSKTRGSRSINANPCTMHLCLRHHIRPSCPTSVLEEKFPSKRRCLSSNITAMLTCHRCMKRCLQTLIGDSEPAYTPPLAACSINHPRKSYGRTLYTTSRAKSDSDLLERRKRTTSISKSNLHIKKGADSTSFNRQKWLESRGVTPLHKRKEEQTDDTLVRNQLRHLKDPLKLAEHIRKTLREDGFEDALAIVRAASKNTQCVVSWNHLIDWQLSQGKMNGALKTYNEVFRPPYLYSVAQINTKSDEKESSDSRCTYIYNNFQRLRGTSSACTSAGKGHFSI